MSEYKKVSVKFCGLSLSDNYLSFFYGNNYVVVLTFCRFMLFSTEFQKCLAFIGFIKL